MKTGITLSSLCPLILLIAMVVASTRVSAQQKATTLHAFAGTQTGGVADGAWPIGELVADKRGNLYGTTAEGGTGICTFDPGCGTVFELSPLPSGKWKMKIIYSFQGGTDDGAGPEARLSVDASGNLYGTTYAGGGSGCVIGCGTVFELQRVGSQWEEAVLYKFTGGDDGGLPGAPVTLDDAGNIYGTTVYGGPHGCGD